ncbi:MAG: universal stress protein [Rhizomicrobium sp.]|jgi:nucleotide-binding universal stress UspA family protein
MAYKKFLAPLTGGARDAGVLASAFAAARPFDGHVVALFVRPNPAEAMPFFGEGVSGSMVQEIVDVAKEAADKASAEARVSLEAAAREAGSEILATPTRRNGLSVSFQEERGNFADRVTLASRVADVVVFGPLREGDKPGLTEAFESVLLQSGRPVLLAAQSPPKSFAQRIAIAWDGSIASAHALTAAMAYLARAQSIEFLMVKRPGEEFDCNEPREYISLYGLASGARAVDAGSKPIGQALLDGAAAGGADLLVLGGYGHSRLRQLFAGGVTKHVVSHSEVPLFLVH